MSVAQRCRQEFSSPVVTKGNIYFRQGRVEVVSRVGKEITAAVDGNSGDYQVRLDLSEADQGVIRAGCTCPYAEGYSSCKHIWATLLSVENDLQAAGFPREEEILVELDESLVSDLSDDEEDGQYLGSQAGLALRSKITSSQAASSSWKHQLASLRNTQGYSPPTNTKDSLVAKTREIWFVLDIGLSTQYGLVIELHQRQANAKGEFSHLRPHKLSRRELEAWPHGIEATMLRRLWLHDNSTEYPQLNQNYSYGYYSSVAPTKSRILLDPLAYAEVLPALCETGRFVWTLAPRDTLATQSQPIVWDAGPPWDFRVAIVEDKKAKQWELRGELARSGGGTAIPLSKPELLLMSGMVLCEGRLGPVHFGSAQEWVRLFRSGQSIRVPFADRTELLRHLYSGPTLPALSLPESLKLNEVRCAPRGIMRIKKPALQSYSAKLQGTISYSYEGREVLARNADVGIIDEAESKVYMRDHNAEQELLQHLPSINYSEPNRYSTEPANVEFAPKYLPQVVESLTAAKWQVEAEGNLIRRPGEYRLSVTSGVDWFELEGEFDFDGVSAKLPDLLAAIRKGERYVKLGDGTQGLLPEAWLAKFGNWAGLGEAADGQVRFKPSQALLLDAMLASQPQVTLDRQFQTWRKKLQSFQGIKAKNQPRGFVGQLRDYQKEGLGWLHFLREFGLGGCLADDMGLGKTIQVLALLQSRKVSQQAGKQAGKPSLIVVPRSLVFNWVQEAARFAPQLKVLDFAHKERGMRWGEVENYDLVITTYGTMLKDVLKLKEITFDYVILDEAQAIKNSASQSAKASRLLSADHRLALTGTPVENHVGELWSLFEFLNPGMLGSSEAFKRFSRGGEDPQDRTQLTALSRAIAPFVLRRTKQQVLKELPAKTEQTIFCDLSTAERKKYDQLRDFYRVSLTSRIETEGLAKSKIHVLEALLRLRQAACHQGLLDEKKKKESSAKLGALLEQLMEIIAEGHKALVFSQFTKLLDIVRGHLDKQQIVYEYLDGQTRDRQKRVDRFQNDAQCPVFLVSLKAGGRGLNLTAAEYVFILDPWWNPAVEAQAVDRAHRIGQTRNVFAYRLIARETVEEKILELQKSKKDLADAIISADSSLLQSLTSDDLRVLLG